MSGSGFWSFSRAVVRDVQNVRIVRMRRAKEDLDGDNEGRQESSIVAVERISIIEIRLIFVRKQRKKVLAVLIDLQETVQEPREAAIGFRTVDGAKAQAQRARKNVKE